MKTLEVDTSAVQIHGKTKREVAETILPKGRKFKFLFTHRDSLGFTWDRIEVLGYLYDVPRAKNNNVGE